MFIKMMQSDGSFKLFDEVRDVNYSGPQTYFPCPPTICKDEDELGAFIIDIVHKKKDVLPREPHLIDASLTSGLEPCPQRGAIVFSGELSESEKMMFKVVIFTKGNTRYTLYTQFPVYICSDSGKTIETIKGKLSEVTR